MADASAIRAVASAAVLALLGGMAGRAQAQLPLTGSTVVHDPSTIVKEGDRYFTFGTGHGLPGLSSTDLRHWQPAGTVFAVPPAWTTAAVPGFAGEFWAPDLAYFNGRYHLYYSVSSWGTNDSAIGLATTPSLATPVWTDHGKVVQSDPAAGAGTDYTTYNCIDPDVTVDGDGRVWLVFGSYFGGIAIRELDPATGKPTNGPTTRIAFNGSGSIGAKMEAAAIHKQGDHYHLFLNLGQCCSGVNSTYRIVTGRSTSITGPYLDRDGVNLASGGGTLLLESTGRHIGPGHAEVFAENGRHWLGHHYYDGSSNGIPRLGLRELTWSADGWPVAAGEWAAAYPFDLDGRDQHGNYPATLEGGAAVVDDAVRGKVLGLAGGGAHVAFPLSAGKARSFSAWVKWNGGAAWQRIFDFGKDASAFAMLTPSNGNGRLAFTLKNGTSEQSLVAATALPMGEWHHVAVTIAPDGGSILYLDGEVAASGYLPAAPWELLADHLYLGKSQFAADPYFAGAIDDFRIHGRALGGGEVARLAGTHRGGRSAVAYWDFEEGSADVAVTYAPAAAGLYDGSIRDRTGNGHPLSAWNAGWAYYRPAVPATVTPATGEPNRRSVENANAFPSLSAIGTALTDWQPRRWTLEAAIRPNGIAGFQTIVGRDSRGAHAGNPALAALYFSVRPGGTLAIQFTDAAGNNWNLASAAGAIAAGQWQAVAATCDGQTLRLYRRNLSTGEPRYSLLGTLDLSTSANPALHPGAGDGTDWDRGVITVGRGLFDGVHTDRFLGFIDDVRLSAAALTPREFLYRDSPTEAHWNFEQGSANTAVPYAPATPGAYDGSIADVSGNGNPLSAWSTQWAWYRPQVPLAVTPRTGVPNTLSVQNSGSLPALSATGTGLSAWRPAEWTIEAVIRPDSVAGYQTIVGRDSRGADDGNPAAAALYFSVRPGGVLAIQFTDESRLTRTLESAPGSIAAGQWQAVAATSDGTVLRLYRRNLTTGESAFTLLGALDLSASPRPALHPGEGDGADWDRGVISVARGLFDGDHADRFFGHLDDLRLSSAALTPDRFLYVPQPPSPGGLAAVGGSGRITLGWSAVAGTESYTVKRATGPGEPFVTLASGLTGTAFIDEPLDAGITRHYLVTATNDGVESPPSAAVSGTTHTAAEAWRLDHFGTTADSGNAADNADPDGDGWPNANEFAAGTDPNDRGSLLRISALIRNGGDFAISFPTVAGHRYFVEASEDLSAPSWQPIVTNGTPVTEITGTGEPVEVTDTGGALHPRRFYRIVVSN
jgi:hypothetical protein